MGKYEKALDQQKKTGDQSLVDNIIEDQIITVNERARVEWYLLKRNKLLLLKRIPIVQDRQPHPCG